MLDIETMGRAPNGALASVGIVKFQPFGDLLADPFYIRIRLEDQMELQREFNAQTIIWWLSQEREAQKELIGEGRVSLQEALNQIINYVGNNNWPCWAYGSTFDHTILQSSYDCLTMKNPFHYRQQVCMRGLVKLAGVECPEVPGIAHNAIDDAIRQAKWLQACMKKLKGGH